MTSQAETQSVSAASLAGPPAGADSVETYEVRAAAIWRRRLAIELHADAIVLPPEIRGYKPARLPYSRLRSVTQHRGRIRFETPRHVYSYRSRIALDALWTSITNRLAALPDGQKYIADLKRRSQTAQRLSERTPVATWTLIVILVVFFLVQCAVGSPADSMNLARLGAGSRLLIADGQINRLISAVFLHLNAMHLFSNVLALWLSGRKLEPLIGYNRFLLIFLLSGLVSSLASLVLPVGLFVGASGGVFGLIAAQGVQEWRFKSDLPFTLRTRAGVLINDTWYVSAIFGLAGALWQPQINWVAHLAGMITGALCAYAFVRRREIDELLQPNRRLRSWCGALVGMSSSMLATSVGHATHSPDADWVRIISTYMHDSNPDRRSSVARELARCPSASAAQIAWAGRELTGLPGPDNTAALGLVDYRLGDLTAAIKLQITLPAAQADLARSLDKSRHELGVLRLGPSASDYAVQLRAASASESDIRIEPALPSDHKAELYLVAERAGQLTGLLTITLPPGGTNFHVTATDAGPESWPAGTAFDLALVLVMTRNTGDFPTPLRWRYRTLP